MTVKLSETAVLELVHDDVAAILTSNFSSSYEAFAGMAITLVEETAEGGFRLTFSRFTDSPGAEA